MRPPLSAACTDLAPLEAILARHAGSEGALLPVLQDVQRVFGFVPSAAVPRIAGALNLSRAEIHGVLDFYEELRTGPPGRVRVQICRAEACRALGAGALEAAAVARLGLACGETAADASVTLQAVYCLGNCACGPSVRIGDEVHGRVDGARLVELLAAHREAGAADRRGSDAPAPAPAPTRPALRLFLPDDTTACALGADTLAAAIIAEARRRGLAIALVRNGSRGAYWLEPLLEIERGGERLGFGPVAARDVPGLFAAEFPAAGHPLALGPVARIPWLARQQRLTFRRAGLIDPLSLTDYRAHDGMKALEHALALPPQAIVDAITASGLRGRGGAAFAAGIKWQTVLDTPAAQKYVLCNAEEGDSGTFADRLLIEADPFQLIEGMTISGLAVGATRGYIGLRAEYPRAAAVLARALAIARGEGWIGADIRGSGRSFDVELRIGAGAYVSGEESALMEGIEGRRGTVRARPPLPAVNGLFGRPTLVHNVLSLAAVTTILERGAPFYRDHGMGRSRGTLALQLGGNVRRGGLVELAFGATLRELVEDFGGGTLSGRPMRAIQVGGPLGAWLPASQWDTPLDYEAFAARDALLGHGGVVVFDDTVDMREQARLAFAFCAHESCGKCTPCRIGSTRGVELIGRITRDGNRDADLVLLNDLCDTMTHGSLCALGGLTPLPVLSALRHFAEDFETGRHKGSRNAAVLPA
jgi:formate dehydrogenase iron-sulfur subunit